MQAIDGRLCDEGQLSVAGARRMLHRICNEVIAVRPLMPKSALRSDALFLFDTLAASIERRDAA